MLAVNSADSKPRTPMLVRHDYLAHRGSEQADVSLPGLLGLAVGFAASIAAMMISRAFGAGDDPRVGLVLLTLTALMVSAVTTVPGVIGAGALCWAFYSGFVLNRTGNLTLDRGGGPVLLVIVLSATVASALAGLLHRAEVWPTEEFHGLPVPLPGGEVGLLQKWHHAEDHSWWRWSVEFSNHTGRPDDWAPRLKAPE
jgi:hypothetical protein